MIAHTTNLQPSQPEGWEIITNPSIPGARACRKTTDAGTLVVMEPSSPSCRLCAIFPGFTGDAATHTAFIRAALDAGLGVVCVTPKWGNSTRRIRENAEALFTALPPFRPSEIRYFRAVSFGAYLSLPWLAQINGDVEKIGFVTPCSADHLTHAAKEMKIDLRHDDHAFSVAKLRGSPGVRVLTLDHDHIVPDTDALFLGLSHTTERGRIARGDHYMAGEQSEASADLVKWFAETGGRVGNE